MMKLQSAVRPRIPSSLNAQQINVFQFFIRKELASPVVRCENANIFQQP